jgi:hypothetical protein
VHVVEAKSHDRAKRFEHRIYVGETKPREREPSSSKDDLPDGPATVPRK